jgi:hypothetical protein
MPLLLPTYLETLEEEERELRLYKKRWKVESLFGLARKTFGRWQYATNVSRRATQIRTSRLHADTAQVIASLPSPSRLDSISITNMCAS